MKMKKKVIETSAHLWREHWWKLKKEVLLSNENESITSAHL